ncbi:MAG: tetraacyldisaccharide 4'-kinase [Gammaproteobacteria bacterium]|nr:tetraacyldisaccharide 4'-kinase [Gammaproteobacteria bacterium]NNF50455.1 tetraacyldisaccharide 4'-kinase [Woeseiaceae bacterium]MBT8094995.1 tetraacyldisaccharide 4'-kinase [Gammaproteobacteria bacterium]MBT8104665.1 tetraacyldisaccharide 4'-kinase [Gammaproteobacteria bacterium]NNK24679.1 tetraacyldisaccharide 4'-kinase [Woeseiaceae bacterium]
MSAGPTYNWLHRVWYDGGRFGWILLPLSALYWFVIIIRKYLYDRGVLRVRRATVPVVIVGNITAGGTGKTPTVLWLVEELKRRGFSPGIVSRGYGGSQSGTSMRVEPDSDAVVVGDEPVLLARRARCPVVVDPDRVRAAEMLVEDGVDVVVADDGLQHYRLARDYEICVVDGVRGLGNRRLLPAGPLRETVRRLDDVEQVLVNGRLRAADCEPTVAEQNAISFELLTVEACRLNGSLTRAIERFGGTTVHAVAGIGNPQRFFDLLRAQGIQVIEHRLPDHAKLRAGDLEFGDDFDVFMTEKDAVKLGRSMEDKFWYVPVDFSIDPLDAAPLLEQIESRVRARQAGDG